MRVITTWFWLFAASTATIIISLLLGTFTP
jgi:hypothetical protein